MGLPVFREPRATESKPKTAKDPSAAARSTIRRPAMLGRIERAPRHPSASSTSSSNNTTRRQGANSILGHRTLLEIVSHETLETSPLLARSSLARSALQAEADRARTEVSNRRRLEMGRALLRDALSFERPGRMLRDSVHRDDDMEGLAGPPPPVPEPSDYAGSMPPSGSNRTEALHGGDPRRRLEPSLSDDDDDGEDLIPFRSRGGVPSLNDRSSSYSSRFAPAYRFDGPESSYSNVDRLITSLVNRARSPIPTSLRPGVQPPNESTDDVAAPTSQTSRPADAERDGLMLPRRAPGNLTATLDGLGDRDRSLSPEDNWETLLMTITPDNQLPSADSSFTSATASASSMPSQATSASTSITAPDDTEISPTCDFLTSSDSDDASMPDTEPDLDEDWVSRYAARVLQNHQSDRASRTNQGSSTSTEPTTREQRRRQRHNSHHTHRRLLRHGRLDDDESFDRLVDELHLRDMHRILDTLARREDIPDDWWAAVGLSRNLPRSLAGAREGGS